MRVQRDRLQALELRHHVQHLRAVRLAAAHLRPLLRAQERQARAVPREPRGGLLVIDGVAEAREEVPVEIADREDGRVHAEGLVEVRHLRRSHGVHAHPHRFLGGERGNAPRTARGGLEERGEGGGVGGAEGDEIDALENAVNAAEDDEAVQIDGPAQLLEKRTLQNVQNAHVLVKQRQQRLDVVDRLLVLRLRIARFRLVRVPFAWIGTQRGSKRGSKWGTQRGTQRGAWRGTQRGTWREVQRGTGKGCGRFVWSLHFRGVLTLCLIFSLIHVRI